jgi:3-phenylpropionate/cinnamic acid dioxygenase small subunit
MDNQERLRAEKFLQHIKDYVEVKDWGALLAGIHNQIVYQTKPLNDEIEYLQDTARENENMIDELNDDLEYLHELRNGEDS